VHSVALAQRQSYTYENYRKVKPQFLCKMQCLIINLIVLQPLQLERLPDFLIIRPNVFKDSLNRMRRRLRSSLIFINSGMFFFSISKCRDLPFCEFAGRPIRLQFVSCAHFILPSPVAVAHDDEEADRVGK